MSVTKKEKQLLISNTGKFKDYNEADKIISYLGGKEVKTLPANLKLKLDRYYFIHGLRLRYQQHSYIIGVLKEKFGRNEKQARIDIKEAEYVLGKAIDVSRQYELNFLLQMSMKNIELAMASKEVKLITMALDLHHKLLGPVEDNSEIPDASKFEQHIYNFVLPEGVADLLKTFANTGAVDLSKVLPNNKTIHIQANDEVR